ncbi:MAG: hypothetical protein HC845_12010 [Akkermansiaceae bacterium]|nr:hypothetical protein [Akkermansiaceae bacterium]
MGENFFRVVNNPGFKIAQTGSGTGNNSGGPGFTFKDEFHPTLTHVPYVLSMANSGPNTNGSQIFFTGSVSIPSLNNIHTVFGLVTDTPSQGVIDAIIAAGDNGSTITGISISRTDAAAVAFNEFAQNLPTVVQPSGSLAVSAGVSATWNFSEPIVSGEVFRVFRSTTLASESWAELKSARRHIGIGTSASTPSLAVTTLENPIEPKAFYNLSVARHPGAVGPSDLVNRTITLTLSSGTLTFAFNASGSAGTTTFLPTTGNSLTGPFTTFTNVTTMDPNFIVFITDTPAIIPRYLRVKIGCDTATTNLISGQHSTQSYSTIEMDFVPFASGPVTITR